jgi:hypothetical protein
MAQQAVTTTSGTSNQVPKFVTPSNVVDSAITESNGRVGIGTTNPVSALHVNGNILLVGQQTHQLTVTGHSTSGRFGQDSNGLFSASDTPGAAIRLLTNDGSGLNETVRVNSSGIVTATPPLLSGQTWKGQAVFGPDGSDAVRSYIGQAGHQVHFRLSRSEPERLGNPNARHFIISPYDYGIGIEYPSTIEVWSRNFSIHQNHQGCSSPSNNYLDDNSCNAASHFWIGDSDDSGGWFGTAYDALGSNGRVDRSQSFVMLASDTFQHTSHGDMLFVVRDPADGFRFQSGANGAADDPGSYKSYTVARIDSTGKGYFNGGT